MPSTGSVLGLGVLGLMVPGMPNVTPSRARPAVNFIPGTGSAYGYYRFAYYGCVGIAEGGPVEPASCGTDLMARGMAWLGGQLKAHVGEPIVYQRGDAEVALCATFGRKLFKLDDGAGGIRMEWTDRDFLVSAADLVLSGTATLPRRGDRVRQAVDSGVEVYEVVAPGGEAPWNWCDPFRRMLRIHAKHVATEDH